MVSIILKRVQNARNYLSNERLCTKFGRFFAEILISEYQEISRSGPYSKLKTERGFHREVQNVTGPESQASLTRGTDAKWLYPTNLDANSAFYRRQPYNSLYVCMYVNLYLNTGNHQLSLS